MKVLDFLKQIYFPYIKERVEITSKFENVWLVYRLFFDIWIIFINMFHLFMKSKNMLPVQKFIAELRSPMGKRN